MNIAKILEEREPEWKELEELTSRMARKYRFGRKDRVNVTRFVSLYRQACSDLALAESYHFPPGTVRYLNNLVGLAHHQLYRSERGGLSGMWRLFFVETPRRLVSDPVFWVAMVLFWLPFLICYHRSSTDHEFVRDVIGETTLEHMEAMYSKPFESFASEDRLVMVGFYIKNNAGIGLQCFSFGILGGIGGLFIVAFNSIFLGTVFGAMSGSHVDPAASAHFREFVLSHGPFELMAIVLSAAAGMRMGFAFIWTGGYSRFDSVRRTARGAVPIMAVACTLFCMAALLEAFVSPSPFFTKEAKELIALFSTVLLVYYIAVLGGIAAFKSIRSAERSSPGEGP